MWQKITDFFILLADPLTEIKYFFEHLNVEFLILAFGYYECKTMQKDMADYIVENFDIRSVDHLILDCMYHRLAVYNEFGHMLSRAQHELHHPWFELACGLCNEREEEKCT